MSLRIRFSDQAQMDLQELWDYVAEYSDDAADQRIDRIIAVCQMFADNPELGRKREEFRVGLRSFVVANYLIFYRVWPDRVDILRVLYGARNLEELLTTESEETFNLNP